MTSSGYRGEGSLSGGGHEGFKGKEICHSPGGEIQREGVPAQICCATFGARVMGRWVPKGLGH